MGYVPKKPRSSEDTNRGKRPGWLHYMKMHPIYFETVTGRPYNKANLEFAADQIFGADEETQNTGTEKATW